MREVRWHILGAGAIGCLFAEVLENNGYHTTLVTREPQAGDQLTIIVERGDARSEHQLRAITTGHGEPISYLLVTTKAYDVRDAVAGVAPLLEDEAVVLLLTNGMGLAGQVCEDWPGLDVYCGITTEGAYGLGAQHIRHAGTGETRIGKSGVAAAPHWFNSIEQSIGHSRWDAQIDTALWQKLAVNCVINPLTAVHNCHNGELAQRPGLAGRVEALCNEVASVCRAAGYSDIANGLADTVAGVIAGTAANRSSMLQDVSAGRPSEIDYINGYLVNIAREHGIDTPMNIALIETVKQREH